MAWTNISVSAGQILTSAVMNNLYQNFSAINSGSSGAPRIGQQAFNPSLQYTSVETSKVFTTSELWVPPAGYYIVKGSSANFFNAISVYRAGSWQKCSNLIIGTEFISDGSNFRIDVWSGGGNTMYYVVL